MSETTNGASTRRQLMAGAAVTTGGVAMLGFPALGQATNKPAPSGFANVPRKGNDPKTILAVAATAEVLATIVNTVGFEAAGRLGLDAVTTRNIRAAAREELVHFQVLTSPGVGGKELTRRIWVPDAVFASKTSLLSTLEVGDQIFVNAYMIGTTVYGNAGNGTLARVTSEFMGVEAVHRALARQSLGKLGNDRVFMKFDQPEGARDAPNAGSPGFVRILDAVAQLQAAGFGFGAQGATPGRFYEFDEVSRRTPTDPDLNTFSPR